MILELHRQGVSVSAIARRVGLDRKTVRRYIAQGLEPPAYGPRQPRVTLLQAFEPFLRQRLAAFPQLTGRRLPRDSSVVRWATAAGSSAFAVQEGA
jgi:transposase